MKLDDLNKGVTPCPACGIYCKYSSSGQCNGPTSMSDAGEHLCSHHAQHGAPNNWYVSYDTNKDGPIQRMVGGTIDANEEK